MLWQYRTILFEFTKDGLLGDRYVDDEEMEKTLNQMGQDCWELVDVSLLQDGLLAFLKRPVGQEDGVVESKVQVNVEDRVNQRRVEPQGCMDIPVLSQEKRNSTNRPPISGRTPMVDEEDIDEEPVPRSRFERTLHSRKERNDNDFVGGIRIS